MSAKYENASARSSRIMKALDRADDDMKALDRADDEKVRGFSATVIHEAVRQYGELSRREEDLVRMAANYGRGMTVAQVAYLPKKVRA